MYTFKSRTAKMIETTGHATLWRDESYNGNSTPVAEWIVTEGIECRHAGTYGRKKDAMQMFNWITAKATA